MFRYLPLVLANVMRNRRRSLLTVLSVAASICLLGVLGAVYQAFFLSEATPSQALRLDTRNRVSLTLPLPSYYRETIKQIPGVREVMYNQWFGGTYKDARDPKNFFARFGIEPDKLFTIFGDIKLPEDHKRAFLADRAGCIVGRKLAESQGFKVGDRLHFAGDIFPIDLDLTIRGIFDSEQSVDELLFFNILTVWEAPSMPARRMNMVSQFSILAESREVVDRVAAAVDAAFKSAPYQTRTESSHNFQLSFLAFLGNVKMFLISVCAAVTFTVLLVTANTMAMSVRERVREVGILKTLGYRPDAILGMILSEAGLIAFAGGALGCALAAGLCLVMQSAPTMGFPQLRDLSLSAPIVALALTAAVVIGMASSLVPAWTASRTGIVDALRDTG